MKQTYSTNGSYAQRRKRSLLYFLPSLGIMIAIFILSSRTSSDMNVLLPFFQSIFPNMKSFDWGHFVAYFALAFSLDYGFGRRADRLHFKLLIVLLCGAYGLTDEYHQTFVGGRTPDIYDIRNDCIGAAIAMIVVAIPPIHRVWRRGAN